MGTEPILSGVVSRKPQLFANYRAIVEYVLAERLYFGKVYDLLLNHLLIKTENFGGLIRLVEEGQMAPDFTLKADDGNSVSLRNFRGKRVVLYFYPRDGTPGCTTEALGFKEALAEFEKEDVVILGLSKDTVESHRKFKEKHGLPFTLLSDPDVEAQKLYGVWKQKSLYGRSFMGTERTTFLIDEKGVIKKIYRKVKPKGHAQICLLDLNANFSLSELKKL